MNYWGLEPLDKSRQNWLVRCAAVSDGGTAVLSGVNSSVQNQKVRIEVVAASQEPQLVQQEIFHEKSCVPRS
jgi:hypothetical protein